MTLTTNGKNYIANKFGNVSKCYVASGLNWTYLGTDSVTYPETGGTAQIVSRLVMTSLVESLTIEGITYTYFDLKTANDNTNVTLSDAQLVAQNDGTPIGENQYCFASITGDVSFVSSPAGASIYIDNVLQSVITPATITGLSPGGHTYKLTLTGYRDTTENFGITTGTTTNVGTIASPIILIVCPIVTSGLTVI